MLPWKLLRRPKETQWTRRGPESPSGSEHLVASRSSKAIRRGSKVGEAGKSGAILERCSFQQASTQEWPQKGTVRPPGSSSCCLHKSS